MPHLTAALLSVTILLAQPAAEARGVAATGDRIVGGEDAAYGEFPWIVSLRHKGLFGRTHFCGGTVYTSEWVITAAHCCIIYQERTLVVKAGDYHRTDNTDEFEQEVDVEYVIMHEYYEHHSVTNDICLVRLAAPLQLNDHVGPARLPSYMQEEEEGATCTVAGWGYLTMGGGALADVLQKVEVPVVGDQRCLDDYDLGDMTPEESMICAGWKEGGRDSCQGDSGGPLMCSDGELTGIVSWGKGCALPDYPGVYTQVSYFTEWIAENARD